MPALRGFAFARCCGSSSASIPHALTGKVGSGSRRFRPRAAAYDSWLPPVGPIRDFHPPPFIHARRTPAAFGFTLRVSRAWKGAATDTVEIGTSSIGTACGSHFVIGEEYLVYAGGGGVAGATSFLGGEVVTETALRPRLWTGMETLGV